MVNQLVGFGAAGIARRFLVKPMAMYWPSILPTISLFKTLHEAEQSDEKEKYKISRFKFFTILFFAVFIYQLIPTYFAKGLTAVSIICLLTKNKTARFLSSSHPHGGVGLLSFSFDWQTIGSTGIYSPWSTTVNTLIGLTFWQWVVIPICYYRNIWNTPPMHSHYFFPDGKQFGNLNNNHIFNKNGTRIYIRSIDVSKPDIHRDPNSILDSSFKLNLTLFDELKPFYISEFFAVNYLCNFLNIGCVLAHVCLWYGRTIYDELKAAIHHEKLDYGQHDIHNRLNRLYPDFSESSYLIYLALMSVLSVLVCIFTPFKMPWWSSLMSIIVGCIMIIPVGFIQALTGIQVNLNFIAEVLIGLVIPGETVIGISFKSMGYNVITQALGLISDLKVAHYMHINPIWVAISQIVGTIIGAVFNTYGAFVVLEMHHPAIFEDHDWQATAYSQFWTASGIWGSIGPHRFFGSGTPYETLMYAFGIGLLLPVIPYFFNRYYPHRYWHLLNLPILTIGAIPGSYQSGIIPIAISGFITQFYMLRYNKEWFDKFNYIMAVALDAGTALASLVVTLLVAFQPFVDINQPVGPLSPSGVSDYYCHDGNYWDPPMLTD